MKLYTFLQYYSVKGIGLDAKRIKIYNLKDLITEYPCLFKDTSDLSKTNDISWEISNVTNEEMQTLITERKLALFPFSKNIPTYNIISFISRGFTPVFCRYTEFNQLKKELSTLE